MKKYFIILLSCLVLALGLIVIPYESEAAIQYSDNLIPNMTSNTAPSGVANSSRELSFGTSQAFTAFDGNYSNTISAAWTSTERIAWLSYEFPNSVAIAQYIIYSQNTVGVRAPKDWTFEGSNDGNTWSVLDTQINITGWEDGTPKKFAFSNSNSYKSYRIHITANNGDPSYISIGELQMMSAISNTDPQPSPSSTPEPTPQPSGNRAILTIIMINELEREYDLSIDELNAFMSWYDAKDAGSGPAKYKFIKDWNKGPFTDRSEYIIFDKILTFSVDEYRNITS